MSENLESKELKFNISEFYKKNKIRIFTVLFIVLFAIIFFFVFENYKEKKNNLISEKYISAGLLLSKEKKDEAGKILKEIVLSKNEIYSILALNTIIEKELENDTNQVLEYFKKIENLSLSKEQLDLLSLKKALFLIKKTNSDEAQNILKNLINSKSNLKSLAEDLISD